jgi:hypothetical protein
MVIVFCPVHLTFEKKDFIFSPGNGTVNAIKTWSRFCSYQNSGANLTANETQSSIGHNFCQKELGLSSASTPSTSPPSASPPSASPPSTSPPSSSPPSASPPSTYANYFLSFFINLLFIIVHYVHNFIQ